MVKFREKVFVLPAALTLGNVANGAMLAGTGVSIFQGSKAAKQQEEAAEQQQEQNDELVKSLNKISRATPFNPAIAGQAANLVADQKTYSLASIGREAVNLGKSVGAIVKRNKTGLIGGTLAGAAGATVNYVTDKAIQADMKRSGIPLKTGENKQVTKTYSIVRTIGEAAKKNKMMIGLASGMAALPAIGYLGEKKQLKAQIKATTSKAENNTSLNQENNSQKTYSFIAKAGTMVKGLGSSLKTGFNNFKAAPGKSVLSGVSTMTGGGGATGVRKFGKNLVASSKANNSKVGEKIGKFIQDNPKTALAASVPVGIGVMAGTWDLGDKVVKKTAKKLDKNAFAYENSKTAPVTANKMN